MNCHLMSDRYIIFNKHRHIRTLMNEGEILDIYTFSNNGWRDITPNNSIKPYTRLFSNRDVSNYGCIFRYKDCLINSWINIIKMFNHKLIPFYNKYIH